MKFPPQIMFHGLQPDAALAGLVRQKVDHLMRVCDELLTCRVDVDQLQQQRRLRRFAQLQRPFGVRIHLTLPGQQLSVRSEGALDVKGAVRDAFDGIHIKIAQALPAAEALRRR